MVENSETQEKYCCKREKPFLTTPSKPGSFTLVYTGDAASTRKEAFMPADVFKDL